MKKNRPFIITAAFVMLLTGFVCGRALPKCKPGENVSRDIRRLAGHGGVLVWDRNKNTLFSLNPEEQFIPASTIKLATALAAFTLLGEEYSFPTALFIDSNNNLYIKGFGDPFLISEEMTLICEELLQKGIAHINALYLDDTYFDGLIHVPGTAGSLNPYDALNGALIVNFNTIYIKKDSKGNISSAEQQTPLTPYAREAAAALPPGIHRINLADNPEKSLLYSGELFTALLTQKGITQNCSLVTRKRVPDTLHPLFIHSSSTTLSTIIQKMMEYSNNFIANQLLLALGAKLEGEPATIKKGVKVVAHFLRTHCGLDNFSLSEGSGLSRENRFSPVAMQKILYAFFPYKHLLNVEDGIMCKTGTLYGVSSLVGYYKNKDGHYRQFVIMLNRKRNYRDKIIKLLKENI
ncbi:MAG: D-alanyl-D-alanine carboxypeptidase/D-alanyl-D-alanine-endopeptidase [bacterium]